MERDFWSKLSAFLAEAPLVIDRPKGSRHPRFPEVIYPLDYGYLEGTNGGDGDGIDFWLGSIAGEHQLVGALISVDSLKRDVELKLLVNCTESEIETIVQFMLENQAGLYLLQRKDS